MHEVRRALAIAGIAAVVASAGDLLLLWVAAATRPDLALPSPPAGAIGAGSVAGVGATTPLARALLLPAAPNLAHVIFFAVTAALLR